MMRSKHIHKTVTWLTAALFIPAAILSFSGQVLCIGEDSHMQVELYGDSCCDIEVSISEVANSETTHFRENAGGHSDCGDCSDLDLIQFSSVRVLLRSICEQIVDVSPVPVWSMSATPFANPKNMQVHSGEHLLALTQPKLLLSTTILIC